MTLGSIHTLPVGMRGVDYSFARPPMADLVAYGGFVSRYLSLDNRLTHGKILFPAEVEQLAEADLGVMLNFELAATSAFAGYQAGRAHADTAGAQAENLGVPHGSAIVFSVDTNIDRTRWPVLDAYFHGCNDSLAGAYAVGDYVESDYIDHLDAEGLATLHWWPAASSWSDNRITPLAHVQQLVGTPVAGCDGNVLRRETPFWFPGREPLEPQEDDMSDAQYDALNAKLDTLITALTVAPAGVPLSVEWDSHSLYDWASKHAADQIAAKVWATQPAASGTSLTKRDVTDAVNEAMRLISLTIGFETG